MKPRNKKIKKLLGAKTVIKVKKLDFPLGYLRFVKTKANTEAK